VKTFGHGAQPPAAHDERTAMPGVRFEQARFESELAGEFEGFGLFGDEGVGAAFE